MMCFRIFGLVTAVFTTIAASAQTNLLPLADFYKDRLFSTSVIQNYTGSYFLPASEIELPLHDIIRDSSKQYYEFGEVIFKKHVIEAKGKNYRLNISPILDLTLGKDIKDTSSRRLFQNTRGIYIEGELLKNFSFTTSILENQARFSRYQSDIYAALGELYTNQSAGSYTQQNAVVPSAARTKPFKEDGFDYAFAMGIFIINQLNGCQLLKVTHHLLLVLVTVHFFCQTTRYHHHFTGCLLQLLKDYNFTITGPDC